MQLPLYVILIVVAEVFQHFCVICKPVKKGHWILLPAKFIKSGDFREFEYLSKYQSDPNYILRRSVRDDDDIRSYYKQLSNSANGISLKKILRQDAMGSAINNTVTEKQDELEVLVENELLNALSKKASALLDRPYLQKKGRNDFLVIHPDLHDPFVTVVPNDMYYNSEKKCVNWLEDCNRKGLRERILQKINSPY